MKIFNTKDPKTIDYLVKIGQVVVAFNFVEQLVELLIWELINAKDDVQGVGRRITNRLEFQEKADLLRSLIVERVVEERAKEFTESIYKDLCKCGEARNDIAHSLWFIQYGANKDNPETYKVNFRDAFERGKKFDFSKAKKNIDVTELEDSIGLMDKVSLNIIEFGLKDLEKRVS